MVYYPRVITLLFLFYSACFLGGAFNHAHDIWSAGFLPYRHAPLPFNAYWTSLTILDVLVVTLLFRTPYAGMALAVAIMTSDVAVNFYATYYLNESDFLSNSKLHRN